MRTVSFSAALFSVTLCLTAQGSADELSAWSSNFETAQQEAQRLDRPMLIHFYTDWCFPCRRMEKDVLSRPTVTQVLESRLILVKLNAEHHPQIAQRFGVELFPTDVIVDPAGKRILSSTGYQEPDKYVRFARDAEQMYVANSRPTTGSPVGVTPEPPAEPLLLAINGYCPVMLSTDRKWLKGDPQYTVKHRGQTYYLSSEEAMAAFEEEPSRYAPQLLGCDPVVLMDTDLAVLGSVKFGAFYDGQLFLFTTSENRVTFKEDPERYTRTRVVKNVDEIDRPLVR